MLSLIGLIAVFLFVLLSAAAGKLYHKQRSKKKKKKNKKQNKHKNRNPSPSQESGEDLELGCQKSTEYSKLEKPVTEEEEDVVGELMKGRNLSGPPRFLFTIEEETSEDLASEDEKKQRTRTRKSLFDLMRESEADGKLLTPIASPVNKSTRALTGRVHDGSGLVNAMFDSSNMKLFKDAEGRLGR